MPPASLIRRPGVSCKQGALILTAYSIQQSPKEAAHVADTSLNTARRYYRLIRARLVEVGYYTETPLSLRDRGMEKMTASALKARRGLRDEDIPFHAAEIIEWSAEHPPRLVLKHIRKIIDFTGPLDTPKQLSEAEYDRQRAYIRYARTELIHERVEAQAETDESQRPFLERIEIALEGERRAYRATSKRVERRK